MLPLLSAYTYSRAIFYSSSPVPSAYTYLIPLVLTAYMYMSVRYRIEAKVVPFCMLSSTLLEDAMTLCHIKVHCKRTVLYFYNWY
jgi:hypothetical protein